MAGRDTIVIGASAGGIEALPRLMARLPQDLPAAVFVVQHTSPHSRGLLGRILDRVSPLKARLAVDNESIHYGHIYVAPPDHHLLVRSGHVRVIRGPKENRTRPAVDPLFRSAAAAYGSRVIGVVLTGLLDDGTAGMHIIKRCGGIAIVQDPNDASYPGMPLRVLEHVAVDYCLPLNNIAAVLDRLAREPVQEFPPIPKDVLLEAKIAEQLMSDMSDSPLAKELGALVPVSCPECGGPLWELHSDKIHRYRCRVGHTFMAVPYWPVRIR